MTSQIRVLIITAIEHKRQIEQLMESDDISVMRTIQADLDEVDAVAALPIDAIVLRTNEMTEDERAFIDEFRAKRKDVATILACEKADVKILEAAMQCGITKAISVNESAETFAEVIKTEVERMVSRNASASAREYESRVIMCYSPNGGAGSTTFAVNIAAALHDSGKKVIILDGDLLFGTVDEFLNIEQRETIADLVSEGTLNQSGIAAYITRHSSGIHALCSPESPELSEGINAKHIERIITVLRAEYDYVIIDSYSRLDDITLTCMEQSDTVYLLTLPTIPHIKNCNVFISLVHTLGLSQKVKLVINQSGESFLDEKKILGVINVPLSLSIPYDAKTAREAENRGLPMVFTAPKSEPAVAIKNFLGITTEGAPQKKGLFGKNKTPKPKKEKKTKKEKK